MKSSVYILILSLSVLLTPALAQKKHKMKPFYRGRYQPIKIPKDKKRVICPENSRSRYPYQSIGFKLGDPFAVSYKAYFSPKVSFAMDLGKSATGLYSEFHKDNFIEETQPDTVTQGNSVNYFFHQAKKDGVFNAKILLSNAFRKLPEMKYYIGAGVSYRWTDMEYDYIFETITNLNELKKYQINRTTLGPQVTAGLEYTHPDLPISSFLELEMYYDIGAWAGWSRILGGVGLRYSF